MLGELLSEAERRKLEETAWEVRRKFEIGEAYTDELLKLYIKYSPVLANAIAFFSEARDLFPAANCGLATVALRDRLRTGFPSQDIYYEKPDGGIEYHTVLEIDGQDLIVDITADQFDGPKVYVGQVRDPWKRQAA